MEKIFDVETGGNVVGAFTDKWLHLGLPLSNVDTTCFVCARTLVLSWYGSVAALYLSCGLYCMDGDGSLKLFHRNFSFNRERDVRVGVVILYMWREMRSGSRENRSFAVHPPSARACWEPFRLQHQ